MSVLTRAVGAVAKSFGVTPTRGWQIPQHWPMTWWQEDRRIGPRGPTATAEACLSAYSQTLAILEPEHLRYRDDGGVDYIRKSNMAIILRKPNHYQTRSDFMLNLVRNLMAEGNAYAVAERSNGRVTALHITDSRATQPFIDRQSGDVFYSVAYPETFLNDPVALVPQRDMLHIKLHTPHEPLRGESPIRAAGLAMLANGAISSHQATFFNNMSRPSGVLYTDQKLSASQVDELRTRWESQSADFNSGKTPILTSGLRWEAMSLNSQDAQMVEAFRMTVEDISRAFRVPLAMVNVMGDATYSNTDQLLRFWLSTGLGFVVDHVENAIADFFRLPPDEHLQLNTDVLMRMDLKSKFEAYGEAVIKGIMSPDEARGRFNLPKVPYGDEPRVQQQVVPLSHWAREQDRLDEQSKPIPEEPPVQDPEPVQEESVSAEVFRLKFRQTARRMDLAA